MSNLYVGYRCKNDSYGSFNNIMQISDETLMEYLLENQDKPFKQIVKMIVQNGEPDSKILSITYIERVE